MEIQKNEESINDIYRLIELQMYDEAEKYLCLYAQACGEDEECRVIWEKIRSLNPKRVSVICLGCSGEYVSSLSEKMEYPNCSVSNIQSGGSDLGRDIWQAVSECDGKYIFFAEEHCMPEPEKIAEQTAYMDQYQQLDIVTCQIRFLDGESGECQISECDRLLEKLYKDSSIDGTLLMEQSITLGINLFGNLSCLCVRREALLRKERLLSAFDYDGEYFPFLFEALYGSVVGGIDKVLLNVREQPFDPALLARKERVYQRFLHEVMTAEKMSISTPKDHLSWNYRKRLGEERKSSSDLVTDKKITFFYTDKGEYYNLEPISIEAKKRGYHTLFTEDVRQKADIGIYCQHICHPQNSKISLVLLHDMAQGHNRWPDIWNIERWNEFDAGILPGGEWADRWSKCAGRYYANPREGVYNLGYPKSDIYNRSECRDRVAKVRDEKKFKYPLTVLYAPSWENNDKEDDFVLALQSLQVNLLIKQASWPSGYAQIVENIRHMRLLHEGKYDNVYFLEPEESILTALGICDLVVSDESSVMTEALMLNKPSIAVTDWLIPDCSPPRLAYFPGDYVYKCKKVQLRETVEGLLGQLDQGEVPALSEKYFSNVGNCNSDIMDLIDYLSGNGNNTGFCLREVAPCYMPFTLWG